MSDIRLSMTGSDAIAALFAKAGSQSSDILEDAMLVAAKEIVNAAARKAPVAGGTLRRSIMASTETKTATSIRVVVGPDFASAPYGMYVEFGTGIYAEGGNGRQTPWVYKGGDGKFYSTKGMKPKPFMRPAFDESKAAVVRVFEREITRAIGGQS